MESTNKTIVKCKKIRNFINIKYKAKDSKKKVINTLERKQKHSIKNRLNIKWQRT